MYQSVISKHLLSLVESASQNWSAWTRTSALPLFPLLSLLPINTSSFGLEKAFYTAHQGTEGQKLIRTIHKPYWKRVLHPIPENLIALHRGKLGKKKQ